MADFIVVMISLSIHLSSCCKSNVKETINNIQTSSDMRKDVSALLESHRSVNMMMIILILAATVITLSCCYACTKHVMTVFRRSLTSENTVHYGINPNRDATFTIPK